MSNLNLNECNYQHPWASSSDMRLLNRYAQPDGVSHKLLRHNIAQYSGVAFENVTLTAGGDAAIREVLKRVRPRRVYKYSPTYDFIDHARAEYGYQIFPVEIPTTERWRAMEMYNPKAGDLIYVCNPNNPTGDLWSEADLAELVRRHPEQHIIVDEAYIEFSPAGVRREVRSNVYTVRTFSKAYGLAGVRLGYIISERPFEICFKAVTEWAKECGLKVFDHMSFYQTQIAEINRQRSEHTPERYGNFVCIHDGRPEVAAAFLEQGYEVRQKYGVTRVTLQPQQDDRVHQLIRKYPGEDLRRYYTPVSHRAELVRLLRRFADVFHKKWWITDGTYLGAVRHQTIIPWDDDVDLVVPELTAADIELLSRHYNIKRNRTDIYWQIGEKRADGQHPRDGPHIDLFTVHRRDGRWINTDARWVEERPGDCNIQYRDAEIEDLQQLPFYDFTVPAPRKDLDPKKLSTYEIRLPDRVIVHPAF
jgi:histidinol-phosphate/aromatic aminotransferase/cobyric acid decarboxylase-like protein